MNGLEDAVTRIGQRMVACDHECGGISCDQARGLLPRCLILESRPGASGCAVVGINPGHAKQREIDYYNSEGATYRSVVQYWHERITSVPYYERLRTLATSFGFDGPLLWTELAKCENAPETRSPPLATLRACTGRFLTHELKAIP